MSQWLPTAQGAVAALVLIGHFSPVSLAGTQHRRGKDLEQVRHQGPAALDSIPARSRGRILQKNVPAHGSPYDSKEDAERGYRRRLLRHPAEVTVTKTGWLSQDRNRNRLSLPLKERCRLLTEAQ